jgi:hypothetical protein
MHLSSLLVALGVCGAIAAPLEQQQPLAGSGRRHGGPHKVSDPYTPDGHDPYDKKIDSQADKLQPLPWVSLWYLACIMKAMLTHISAQWRRRDGDGPSEQGA